MIKSLSSQSKLLYPCINRRLPAQVFRDCLHIAASQPSSRLQDHSLPAPTFLLELGVYELLQGNRVTGRHQRPELRFEQIVANGASPVDALDEISEEKKIRFALVQQLTRSTHSTMQRTGWGTSTVRLPCCCLVPCLRPPDQPAGISLSSYGYSTAQGPC